MAPNNAPFNITTAGSSNQTNHAALEAEAQTPTIPVNEWYSSHLGDDYDILSSVL